MPTELVTRTNKLLEDVDEALAQLSETRAKLLVLVTQDAVIDEEKDGYAQQRSE